jgi:hypothetical protein
VRAGRALLLAAALAAVPGPAGAQTEGPVFVVMEEGLSFPEALADPVTEGLARSGGIGLLAGPRPRALVAGELAGLQAEGIGSISRVGLGELERAVAEATAGVVLVVVIGFPESTDDLPVVVVASGPPDEILSGTGSPGGLTSDTTRVPGLVADVDVAATISERLSPARRDDSPGSSIRVEGRAPTDLYERAVDYRRVATPIGLVVLAAGIGSLAVGLVLLLLRPLPVAGATVALLGLFSVASMVALIPASALPSLEPGPLVVALAALGAAITISALLVGRRDHALTVAAVAGIGLGLLVLDGALGWPTEVTPLLGGGAVLGVRFFGLGNSAAGIVLSGAVLAATRLRPWAGVGLVAGAALFAGLPFLGADLGGGVTLFAATGLWYGWRVRGRMDRRGWAVAGAATVLGAAILVATHAVWPQPTHVTRAVEAGGLVGMFLDRLGFNIRATTEIWPVWLTVVGLPVWLLVAWRRPGPFRPMLADRPRWRVGVMILATSGMIGFVANDTYGTAAVAFAFVSAAMVYPVLRERWTSG